MPYPGEELASLDFEALIGGPLVAIINAQAQAALSTANFIKSVGFKKPAQDEFEFEAQETDEPIYVKFRYPKEITPYQPEQGVIGEPGGLPPHDATAGIGDAAYPDGLPAYKEEQAAKWQMQVLEVPILTILLIPFIRIDLATIDFNAKITSTQYRKTDTSLSVKSSLEAKFGWWCASARLKVQTAYKRTTSQGMSVERTYSMGVHIRAVQDEMPAGMERILSILEGLITERPETAKPPEVERALLP